MAGGRLAVSARDVDERSARGPRPGFPCPSCFKRSGACPDAGAPRPAAGLTLTAVVADAEYGDNSTVRQMLHRLRLPYALGISPTLTVFRGTPTLRVDRALPRPRNRRGGWPDQDPVASAPSATPAATRVAPRRVAQRPQSPVGSRLCGPARDARDRLAAAAARARNLAAVRTGPRPDGTPQALLRLAARDGLVGAIGPLGASALGDRTALSGPQIRTRARPLRGPDVSRLAASHGHQRGRLRLSPERTASPARRPTADVSPGLRLRPRDLHRPVSHQPAPVHALDETSGTTVASTSDLTKSLPRSRSVHLQLSAIVLDLQAMEQRLRQLHCLAARTRRGMRRRRPARWSPAGCVAHLNLTSRAMLPLLHDGLRHSQHPALSSRPPSRYRRDIVLGFWTLIALSNQLRTRTNSGVCALRRRVARHRYGRILAVAVQKYGLNACARTSHQSRDGTLTVRPASKLQPVCGVDAHSHVTRSGTPCRLSERPTSLPQSPRCCTAQPYNRPSSRASPARSVVHPPIQARAPETTA